MYFCHSLHTAKWALLRGNTRLRLSGIVYTYGAMLPSAPAAHCLPLPCLAHLSWLAKQHWALVAGKAWWRSTSFTDVALGCCFLLQWIRSGSWGRKGVGDCGEQPNVEKKLTDFLCDYTRSCRLSLWYITIFIRLQNIRSIQQYFEGILSVLTVFFQHCVNLKI